MFTMVTSHFKRGPSGEHWRTEAFSEEVRTVTLLFMQRMTSPKTMEFFTDLGGTERITYRASQSGYLPTKLVSINPGKTLKIVRTFKEIVPED